MSAPMRRSAVRRVVRWILGGVFVYLGLTKALHPVDFLKVIRQYDIVAHHVVGRAAVSERT